MVDKEALEKKILGCKKQLKSEIDSHNKAGLLEKVGDCYGMLAEISNRSRKKIGSYNYLCLATSNYRKARELYQTAQDYMRVSEKLENLELGNLDVFRTARGPL